MRSIKGIWKYISDGELQLIASSLAFTTVLSIVPFVAVSLAIINYIEGLEALYPKAQSLVLSFFGGPLGNEGVKILKTIFLRLQSGKIGPLGALALALTSVMLIREVESAFHRIFNILNRRPLYKRWFLYWVFVLSFPFILAATVAIGSLKPVIGVMPSSLFLYIVICLVLTLLFKVVPNTKVGILESFAGASCSTLGLWGLANTFKWMTNSVFNYSKFYGSLAAFPAALIWIQMIWFLILLGATITSSLIQKYHHTNRLDSRF